MSDWKDTYLAALQARDEVEKADVDIYNAYTRLADRTTQLSEAQSSTKSATIEAPPLSPPPPPVTGYWGAKPTSPPPPESISVTQIRQDLSRAQQERSDLQTRLDTALRELETLKAKSKSDNRRLAQLTSTVNQLTVRLRDRDEELRGKTKLLVDLQDESVTLNLQLNMADEQAKTLKKENQELVDRWMARMGKEADRMNEEGKFG